MADVSLRLREARERAGLTIEDVSARTRIKVAHLQAIERGEFSLLPGEFFTRAFIRTYARELHLSPDEVVADYDSEHQPADPPPQIVHAEQATQPFPVALPRIASFWAGVALAGLLIAVLMRTAPDRRADPQAVGTSGTSTAAETPKPPETPRSDAPPATLTIEIRPSRVVWMTASADGRRVIYRLLQPGERVTVEARERTSIRVGDAGAFEYSINGAPAKSPGASGEVRQLQITPDNYRTFLR